jgi:hypothetical protein
MNREDTIALQMKLSDKTKEANELRAKLRKNDSNLRSIIRQLEQMLDEAGIPWRDRLEANGNG